MIFVCKIAEKLTIQGEPFLVSGMTDVYLVR
ncbi:hypothetical protein EPYR_00644 [Erwinia pyrifoliae DSM 12163]|nr:hypothetical protein EPYR_00644 [Erwinia pyrifoliae DSM 12163]